ncbi:acetyl-CoA hydrolase/transferase C-terminal domain-containing protein [Pseudomonas sp. NBRC 111119]|uniref:acetyl-CoA hydrolase/transferase C-terminal domain-containing protein n=1 Tax=Pseudomonas sp. NBRC 111119 TaxID=1661034 RepID=UPI00076162FE|nr:acetyl-CoA hydrolase/transferase C-terminal domain-containing protein [Pseudomonas sp. NBRC 111119]
MHLCSVEHAVDQVLSRLPAHIHMGLPLGLGKPNAFVNALYARVRELPERQLTLYTALSLGRPPLGDGLQRRFLEPFVERVFADYEELDYLADLRNDSLPPNIRVEQFFMQPGSLLHSEPAQQDYVSSNYSHAARDINAKGLNLIAQLVAATPERPVHLSLACNPDITLDLLPMVERRRAAGETILMLGQVHAQLPYMPGDAELPMDAFDLLLDEAEQRRLFSTPNMPVNTQDHCIGLHASSLVRDGGTLQIGIGAMGDAVAAALLARQGDNAAYREALDALGAAAWQPLIEREGGLAPLDEGLYGCSEMFVNGLLELADAGLLRRTADEQEVVLHGGFFLGPQSFYQRLRDMPLEQRARFAMTAISFVNELYGDEALKRRQRRDARFINTAFGMTLLGAGVADQLEDGRVLSGVGGQYNFVAQGHALEGGRSILLLRSWREAGGEVTSNLFWRYGHCTIPRHLRDIVVTEYGVADLRGQTDSEVIARLLAVCDSRFQQALMEEAKSAGKLAKGFQLDARFTYNTPERLEAVRAQHSQLFAEYPLGTDFTDVEQDLLRALGWLKSKFKLSEVLALGKATLDAPGPEGYEAHLARMALEQPDGLKEDLYQRLLLAALAATAP